MQIQFPTITATATVAHLTAALTWSVNDILLAEVVGKADGNFTRLAIGDRIVTAQTDTALVLGQKLALRVTTTGTTTVMTVLPTRHSVAVSTVERALARALPQQANPADTEQVLKSFDVIVRQTRAVQEVVGRAAAAELTHNIERLLQALPKPAQLSNPAQLRSVVEQVTVPTEAHLMSSVLDDSTPDISKDIRALFSRVAADLANLPDTARSGLEHVVKQALTTSHVSSAQQLVPAQHVPDALPTSAPLEQLREGDLKTLVESVVARLETNQLQTVVTAPANPLPLIVDLPVAREDRTDFLHMEVDSEEHSAGGESPLRSSVTLNLRLDGGLDFSARLQLSGERLSVRLGASDEAFNDQIAQRVGELEFNLKEAGLEVTQIFVAPLQVSLRPRLGTCQLINEKV